MPQGFMSKGDLVFTINGGCEIKCPNSKTHVEYIIKDEIPKEYWHQTIAPFVASDLVEWWYFVSYDDRNYEKPLFIKKIMREEIEDEIIKIREDLLEFIQSVSVEHEKLTF